MKVWRTSAMFVAVAATVSTVNAAVANAYETVDYGTNEGACRAAAKQLEAAGIRYTNCFETGPGHYSLAWDD